MELFLIRSPQPYKELARNNEKFFISFRFGANSSELHTVSYYVEFLESEIQRWTHQKRELFVPDQWLADLKSQVCNYRITSAN